MFHDVTAGYTRGSQPLSDRGAVNSFFFYKAGARRLKNTGLDCAALTARVVHRLERFWKEVVVA